MEIKLSHYEWKRWADHFVRDSLHFNAIPVELKLCFQLWLHMLMKRS